MNERKYPKNRDIVEKLRAAAAEFDRRQKARLDADIREAAEEPVEEK